ncbi:monodechloroaminopyrrolnitrin synthase PrnB family protein [Congregibacter sp.]|uniref:PrnB family protein n=1 Tax=Congregibacter sp. TaxID=2744308 RepID=UPI00385814A2
MSVNAQQYDDWIRSSFIEINSELEEIYFAQDDPAAISPEGDKLRKLLHDEGRAHITGLHNEGNTDEGFEAAFSLLGNVGLYMGACRRHEITEPSREQSSPLIEASGLALHIGASLGVAPRFATSHLSTHNLARDGVYRSFTRLNDEFLFLDFNTRGIFAYKRAADALARTVPLGVSHPVTGDLLVAARQALEDVARYNEQLFEQLDPTRFFYSVRPYYKPYRVGKGEYRGANAGDFAGINEIDLLLGLCQAEDPSYSQLLVDKFLYMMPEDQARLRDCMRRESLMDQILEGLKSPQSCGEHFEENVRVFLTVCEAHGRTASQHHNQLVERFIQKPSSVLDEKHLTHITASGPPLEVLMAALQKLRDLRMAAPRDNIRSRYKDIAAIRSAIGISD